MNIKKKVLSKVKSSAAALSIAAVALSLSLGTAGLKKLSAAEFTGTDTDVTVTLTTDKDEYAAGEDISFELNIINERAGWQVGEVSVTYSNTEGLLPSNGTELPASFDTIKSGETFTFSGTLVGDEAVFPPVSNEEGATEAPDSTGVTKAPEGTTTVSGETSQNGTVNGIVVGVIVAAVIIIVLLLVMLGLKKKKGSDSNKGAGSSLKMFLMAFGVLSLLTSGLYAPGVSVKAASTDEEVILRPYVKFTYAGQEAMIRMVLKMSMSQVKVDIPADKKVSVKTTACHDPSIFKDTDGTYYVFGTHMALSKSTDLINWSNMDKAFRDSFTKEVKDQIRAYNEDSSAGNWFDYLWAPDVIYNEEMGKYCMYLSANGDNWISNIVLLTADTVTGPYEYAGTIVYGGFTESNYDATDVALVTGEDSVPERYIKHGVSNRKWGDEYPNCIDPCVFYDDAGNLWMSYGSWSGGIFLLKLDNSTGLRDYTVSYETNAHSDAYFGKKIAGGKYVSGEASYIQRIGDYYYLFISYGNLEAKGGYNVRIFRSKNVDGEYVDELGNSALFDSYIFNYNLSVGVRLFGGYKWRTNLTGRVAQGHNSAFVDDDGKAYIVYHSRTTNGTEAHFVKVNQLFTTKEGWLVASPFETSGETLNENGLSAEEVAGDYEMILHKLDIDYANYEVNVPSFISLNADGTITGAASGSWSLEAGTPYIELVIDGETYSGVALMQNIDGTSIETPVFTALGKTNQLTVWGSKSFSE